MLSGEALLRPSGRQGAQGAPFRRGAGAVCADRGGMYPLRTKLMWLQIAALALFCAALFIMLLPTLRGLYYRMDTGRAITAFNSEVARLRVQADAREKQEAERLARQIADYNAALRAGGQTALADPFALCTPSEPLPELTGFRPVLGVLCIPRLELETPVYAVASALSLRRGAALAADSSIPSAEEGTHALIAAQRGGGGSAPFRGIERLRPGDRVDFLGPLETVSYRVLETGVILPGQTGDLRIAEGETLLTLITTHPLQDGEERYIVRCGRLE